MLKDGKTLERDCRAIEALLRSSSLGVQARRRLMAVQRLLTGQNQSAAARAVGVSRPTVIAAKRLYQQGGVTALMSTRPRGRHIVHPLERLEHAVNEMAARSRGGRVSFAAMARRNGLSRRTLQRIRRENALSRRATRISRMHLEPSGMDLLGDVAGYFAVDSDRAIALCFSPHIHLSLSDRPQPPEGTGELRWAIARWERHAVGIIPASRRMWEFIEFLQKLQLTVPRPLIIRVVVVGCHYPKTRYCLAESPVASWLRRNPRVQLERAWEQDTPADWVDLVTGALGGAYYSAHRDNPGLHRSEITWHPASFGSLGALRDALAADARGEQSSATRPFMWIADPPLPSLV